MTNKISRDLTADQLMLQKLYNLASTKLHAAVSLAEAEPAMADFLHFLKEHPEQRSFAAKLILDSLVAPECPWELIQFCMHDLRWQEIRDFIQQQRSCANKDLRARRLWEQLNNAFEDSWEDSDLFREYTRTTKNK